ncbi:hypothetical protein PHYBLDRAFT_175500 [Phycomyces blakesleeanus NRRL 1555(-)]|uniref:Uncharacterized protein n=1 Tax=Phycomyces blakesleeanus (strain ATCC 8743b / DSM 1359 / FGSC 10004 / NBRC 33097 / NRRL 1555) TaxID=763407 RepID=A0A167JKU8_PHYB8|nr:hypothetical protein PHYBLDRAFT_175500 [Phycomyces blakesleeanus NRRL 1555(-)]OAD66206.1 hypothetical protein PHYBLDRAFT_175500 [Phycomyces blakesleeanus NRRL 1555(-)]|eukprot:XP_018284246.1 hypothetical protein PHYBLDRAFT_175500 [Phycomyces blakesleeanus NRRL 1555(-)]
MIPIYQKTAQKQCKCTTCKNKDREYDFVSARTFKCYQEKDIQDNTLIQVLALEDMQEAAIWETVKTINCNKDMFEIEQQDIEVYSMFEDKTALLYFDDLFGSKIPFW